MSIGGLSRRDLALMLVALLVPLLALATSGLGASVDDAARAGFASLLPGVGGGGISARGGAASADASRSESGSSGAHARIFGRSNGRTSMLLGRTGSRPNDAGSDSAPAGQSAHHASSGQGASSGGSGAGSTAPEGGSSTSGSQSGSSSGQSAASSGATARNENVAVTGADSASGVTVSATDENDGFGASGEAGSPASGGDISVDVTSDDGSTSVPGVGVPSTGVSVP